MSSKTTLFSLFFLTTFTFWSQEFNYIIQWQEHTYADQNDIVQQFSQIKDCGLDNGIPFFFQKEQLKFQSGEVTLKNFDFEIEGTRIVGNQRGKPKDRITDFSKAFTLTF
jgi:hypothetical protein